MIDNVDDPFNDLKAALDVAPSPAFAARVRAEVAESPGRASGWRLATGCALLLVAVVSGTVVWRAKRGDAAVPQSDLTSTAAAATAAGKMTEMVVSLPAPARRLSLASTTPRARTTKLEVLVPPDQAIAVAQLLVALREGRPTLPPAAGPMFDEQGLLLAPTPIEIPEIKFEPVTLPPSGGGLPKEIR
jgi:hypothetical protein